VEVKNKIQSTSLDLLYLTMYCMLFTGYASNVHKAEDFVVLVYCVEMSEVLSSADWYHCK